MLYFYSPNDYAYCRKQSTLLHLSIMISWLSSIQHEPEFLTEVFPFLKSEDSCLVIGSKSISKQTD